MQKYPNSVQDTLGNAISVATVTVYTDSAHTALATIYSDNGITPTTNPRTTDSLGEFSFYAADGRYYIKVTKSGITTQFLDDVLLFDSTASNSSASINTVQSGTGALTRTVSAALRAIVRSGDFDTTGHFNTAQAALTETIGFKALRVGTGDSTGITFPSQTAGINGRVSMGGATFNGVFDPSIAIGVNLDNIGAGEHAFGIGIEQHYYDGANNWVEVNWDYYNAAGSSTRFLGLQINRATDLGTFNIAGASITLGDAINGNPYFNGTVGGWCGIGTNGSTSKRLDIAGTSNTSTVEWGLRVAPNIGSAVTAGLLVIASQPQGAAGSYTVALMPHYTVFDFVKGAGSTLTEQHGYRCLDLAAATNNQGFRSEVTSGANKFGFYASGNADNAFAGNLRLGSTTAPTVALDVTGAGKISTTLTVTGAFGCNGSTAQTAAASGGALAAYSAGANGLDSGAHMSALHALVVAMRAALVANGIMS